MTTTATFFSWSVVTDDCFPSRKWGAGKNDSIVTRTGTTTTIKWTRFSNLDTTLHSELRCEVHHNPFWLRRRLYKAKAQESVNLDIAHASSLTWHKFQRRGLMFSGRYYLCKEEEEDANYLFLVCTLLNGFTAMEVPPEHF